MKKFILLSATLLLTLGMNAQPALFEKANVKLERAATALKSIAKAPAKISSLENNQRILGPYTSDAYEAENGLGLINYPGTYPIAVYMGQGFQAFSGTKLVKIRFALSQATTVNNVFMLAVTTEGAMNMLATEPFTGNAKTGWNEVTLSEPVELDFSNVEAILIGFEYVQTNSRNTGYPLSLVMEDTPCPTYIYGNLGASGEGWYNLGTDDYGSLSVQAIVESDNFAANAVAPRNFGKHNLKAGANTDITVAFANLGTKVNDIDYTLAYDGVVGEETHLQLAHPLNKVGGVFKESITLTAPEATGVHEVTLTVTKVNGVENGTANNVAEGTILSLSKALPKGVVVEEFTGTGCGWCPRGLVGMGKMRKAYGNQFVGIALHQYNSDDAMYNPNYANIGLSSAPSCALNRKAIIDPYFGSGEDILVDLAAELNVLPEIGVSVTGTWNSDKTEVAAVATIDPLVSGKYEIVYALIADQLSGTTRAWKQTNYYSYQYASQTGYTRDMLPDDMKFAYDLEASYSAVFDDVMIESSYDRTNNLAKLGDLTEGEIVTNSFTLYMPESAALLKAIDTDKVAVCALIIDAETGFVANAAKFYLSETEGIAEQGADRRNLTETARYNAAGQQIFAPQKGLNIIQLSDGSTMKIMVK